MDLDKKNIENESEMAAKALTDDAAFTSLFDRYFPVVHKYMLYRVNMPMTADDLTAEVFQRMIIALPRYDPEKAHFRAWLFGIARHVVTDHYRQNKRNREVDLDFKHHLAGETQLPEEASLIKDTDRRLLDALIHLSDREKDLIGLKFGVELTNRQIAHLTGLSESHVGVILYRSLQRLRILLSDMEETNERE